MLPNCTASVEAVAVGRMGVALHHPLPSSVLNLKPDGLAQSREDKGCLLLEFTRTSDFWDDSLDLARNRKHDKMGYVALQSELCKSLPNCTVELLTFVLGDRGMFDQALWTRHLDRLGLPSRLHRGFCDIAVSGAYEVVEDILSVRRSRLRELGSAAAPS